MEYFSQKDPSVRNLPLGKSKLTIGSHGCFVAALASLYQRPVRDVLAIEGAVNNGGYVNSQVVAKHFNGLALPPVKPQDAPTLPKGWCIAMTSYYSAAGYPTHFFLVNVEKKLQIDPLDFPAQPEELTYPIVEYRPFTNVKLVTSQTWQEETKEWCIKNGIITQWNTADDDTMYRVGAAIRNYHRNFHS